MGNMYDQVAAEVSFSARKPFSSEGGFSDGFKRPTYQDDAVAKYFAHRKTRYGPGRYNASSRMFSVVLAKSMKFYVDKKVLIPSVGTSVSTSLRASAITLINQERLRANKEPVSFSISVLCKHPKILCDITSGRSVNCRYNGFAAVEGWDPTTVLGSPQRNRLEECFPVTAVIDSLLSSVVFSTCGEAVGNATVENSNALLSKLDISDSSGGARKAQMLKLSEARTLLQHEYLPIEAGYGLTSDDMYHVAASTYMPNVTPTMIDWWFGFIHTTDQYLLWHPRDHVFSDWEGPRNNDSTYIGGHHLVHEYIGGIMSKLKISFLDPSTYFGENWRTEFDAAGYGTAVCGRVGQWNDETGEVKYTGHLIHLVKTEPDGCRMRSRFWLGDVEGLEVKVGDKIPESMTKGLLKHCTEEMAILASKLPELYRKYSKRSPGDEKL